nr:ABC transporter substrate-binding protein [Paenibacillus marchantiophytorum]
MMKKAFLWPLAALLLLAGCSQPAGQSISTTASQTGSIQDFAGRNIVFSKVPQRIATLSNGELDIVYALGSEVVGRPTSTSPVWVKEAEKALQIGSAHGIDLEKIALLSPDVIFGNQPLNSKDIPSLEALGSKVVLSSANSIEDIKKQIQLVGQVLQKQAKAAELVSTLNEKLRSYTSDGGTSKPRVLLVYGAPGTYMAALNNSLSGDILTKAGGENIAADYPKLESYPQYAQLNTEKIVKSDPQLILLMSHTSPDQVKDGFMKEMSQNSAWSSLDAVKQNRVEVLPADLFGSNPGTRVTESLDILHKLLLAVK